jgi:methylglyoxal synthase
MSSELRLALIAHDQKKDDMVEFVRANEDYFKSCRLYATGTTGKRIGESCGGLDVECLKSGPLGGDQQIGALIATGSVDQVIFFVDPLTPMPHDVDVKALMRLAAVYDIPIALNRATAVLMLNAALGGCVTESAEKA